MQHSNSSSTCIHGHWLVDYYLTMPHLCRMIQQGGYLPFHFTNTSNHCTLWFDLGLKQLFLGESHTPLSPPIRRLNTTNIKMSCHYQKEISIAFQNHDIQNWVHEIATRAAKVFTTEVDQDLNSLDDEIKGIIIHVEASLLMPSPYWWFWTFIAPTLYTGIGALDYPKCAMECRYCSYYVKSLKPWIIRLMCTKVHGTLECVVDSGKYTSDFGQSRMTAPIATSIF